jgi:peptidoglycan hydrolase CwlO-like protein
MQKRFKFLLFVVFVFSLFSFVNFFTVIDFVFAQSVSQTEKAIQAREAELRAELEKTEKEIAEWQNILQTKQGETASLSRDAAILNAKIEQAKLVIKARNLAIENLGKDIGKKEKTIETLEEKIARGKESLSQIIRKTNQIDSYSTVEMILSQKDLSGFFEDIDAFDVIKRSLASLFEEVRQNQELTEKEKIDLAKKQAEEVNNRAVIELEKKRTEQNEAEKKRLISINKTQEKTYAQVLADRQQKAAQIRSALFSLRDSVAIPFGDALKYATEVEKKTGVRAAFLLAILTQESNLGKNVGSCLVTDISTGNGIGKNTGTVFQQVMKAPRDTVPFKDITERLGRNFSSTPISCPPSAVYYVGRGFGGGMGPSQFIPSTWELFKNAIGTALNLSPNAVDPWNPEHAFMATGIYMRDLGASNGLYSSERNAACKYYSGAACTPGRKPANVFYGDQVMATAQNIQINMIDPLKDL